MRILYASISAALLTGIVTRFLNSWLAELGAAVLIGALVGAGFLFLVKPQAPPYDKKDHTP